MAEVLANKGKSSNLLYSMSPSKMMVLEELVREYEDVTPDVRMKVNLLNIKQALKKTHSDKEIVKFFSNLDLID
jgi:hypothetical protein